MQTVLANKTLNDSMVMMMMMTRIRKGGGYDNDDGAPTITMAMMQTVIPMRTIMSGMARRRMKKR